jgi:hypothetical protein
MAMFREEPNLAGRTETGGARCSALVSRRTKQLHTDLSVGLLPAAGPAESRSLVGWQLSVWSAHVSRRTKQLHTDLSVGLLPVAGPAESRSLAGWQLSVCSAHVSRRTQQLQTDSYQWACCQPPALEPPSSQPESSGSPLVRSAPQRRLGLGDGECSAGRQLTGTLPVTLRTIRYMNSIPS